MKLSSPDSSFLLIALVWIYALSLIKAKKLEKNKIKWTP